MTNLLKKKKKKGTYRPFHVGWEGGKQLKH